VDDTDLIVTHHKLTTPKAILEELLELADAWTLGLNSTGGAINLEKNRWILAAYEWVTGIWWYCSQLDTDTTIPLPDGTRAHIFHGDVSTAEKSLGV
jgi:hypothetical protein